MVVSTVGGTTVEISEEIFAAAFVLPTEGLTDLSEVPKNIWCLMHEAYFLNLKSRHGYTKLQASKRVCDSNLCSVEECVGIGVGGIQGISYSQYSHYVFINEKVGAEEVVDAPKAIFTHSSTTMASSWISINLHIAFDSVLDMNDAGLVQMFESFIVTGLKEFLGCPTVIYEAALAEFFKNCSVRDGMVVSTVGGTTVEISEEIFTAAFVLPTEEQVSISYHKREMKIEYRLLSDILAKTIYVKAGSFDAVTRERFLLMTAITFDVKVNWSLLLFDVLKDMVTPGSRQAKGILTEKKVHRYVVINEKVGAEEVVDAPKVKKATKAKVASKKRPADFVATEPVSKKKRATKKKSGFENVPVAQEAVFIQIIEPIPAAPAEEPIVEKSREGTSAVSIDEEISAEEKSAVEVAAATGVQEPAVEHVDEQVAETTADEETAVKDVEMIDEPVSLLTEAAVVNKDVYPDDDVDVIIEQFLAETVHIGADEKNKMWIHLMLTDAAVDLFVEEPVNDVEMTVDEQSMGERTDADEAMSLEDIIMSIPVDVPLPSACVEITKITLGKDIKIPGVDERTWYLASLPQIPVDDKGKEPLLVKDPIKGKPPQEHYSLICADIDLLVQLREQVIDEVDRFFNSFSFKKLPTIKVEDISEKEDQVLLWEETDST
ncbi:hypothetical protein F511_34609 [Dorcoceras hygrometricum]|uniref:Dystroglycan-like n=1 Tax=Dorcoceras hygrometricum TaxID=472368 RepID=A0A2Z7CUM3_9LAMI|nr:hypothetical protein F511_34609 [Dorcoceras hygrometricum]